MSADIDFFFDPVCPFAWVTSRWVHQVMAQRPVEVCWRFISLRMINEGRYEDLPAGYRAAHAAGLARLRVAAAVREEAGNEAVQDLYTRYGAATWYGAALEGDAQRSHIASAVDLAAVLGDLGLDPGLAVAAEDPVWDGVIREETDLAFARAGSDVGTPILTYHPPEGLSLFGPVLSVVPSPEDSVRLWDAVQTLVEFPDFAELKRSLRTQPQVPLLGGPSDQSIPGLPSACGEQANPGQ